MNRSYFTASRHAPRGAYCLTLLALACSSALAQTAAPAQQPAPANPEQAQELDTLVVTGQALSLQRAVEEKRTQDVISDGVSADEVGTIPDYGLGEALERVPGVSAELNNGRGEAQFITVRGLNASYNAVTIDGVRLPSTEANNRNISLDILPSSLGRQMNVYKSFDAANSANAIGGIIDVRTRSAFDRGGKTHAALRAQYGYYENRAVVRDGTPSGVIDGAFSTTFGVDGNWGVVAAASYFRRDSHTILNNNTNHQYYDVDGRRLSASSEAALTAMPISDKRRWYAYDNVRERVGVFAKLQYDNFDDFSFSLTGGSFRHTNDEQRWSHALLQRQTNLTFTDYAAGEGAVAAGSADNFLAWYTQDRSIRFLAAHADFRLSDDSLLSLIASRGRGKFGGSSLVDEFGTNRAQDRQLGYSFRQPYGEVPDFTPNNPEFYNNPDNYFQTLHSDGTHDTTEDKTGVSLRFESNVDAHSEGWGFIGGLDYDKIDRNRWALNERWNVRTANSIAMGQFLTGGFITPFNGGGVRYPAVDGNKTRAFLEANRDLYTPHATNFADSHVNNYDLKEAITALYALGVYRSENMMLRFGVRNENTSLQSEGVRRETVGGETVYSQQRDSSSYRHWLPSINAMYRITPDLVLRAAYSQSVSRAGYLDLVGRDVTSYNSEGDMIISRGNPELDPRHSDNYDLSLEWYFGARSVVSAGLFRKDISNEIATVRTIIEGSDYDTIITQPVNIDQAKVEGLELNFIQTNFDFLPGYWKNFGLSANASLLRMDGGPLRDGQGEVLRQLPALINAPKRMYNASLLWQDGSWNGRLSYKQTGEFPLSYNTTNPLNDIWYRANTTWDLHLGYRFNRQWRTTFQVKNILNERPARMYGPDHTVIRELIDNGRSAFVGVNYVF